VIYRRGHSMRVMVYAGRDPLTGKKKWVSRQIRGTGRAALKEAKQIEAQLLAEVAAGRHQEAQGVKVAELVDRWLEWRQAVKPMSPGTAANYRRCIDLKIKPALRAGRAFARDQRKPACGFAPIPHFTARLVPSYR
jgi:integrase